jgi:predicted ester cyclase
VGTLAWWWRTGDGPVEAATMSVNSIRDVAVRYLEQVFGRGDLALIEELVHPDAQDLSGPWSKGREGFHEHISWFRTAFEPEITIERVVADDEYVVLQWKAEGRHIGPAFGVEATGRPVENSMISAMCFQEGMIIEYEVMFDMLTFLVQVGCLGPWQSAFQN